MPGWITIEEFTLDPRFYNKALEEIAAVIAENEYLAQQKKRLTWRPIRPRDINIAFTVVTEVYNTTLGAFPAVYTRIVAAAADSQVPAGNAIFIFGWYVLDDPTGVAPLGLAAVGQITVETTVRAEVCLKAIDMLPTHTKYTFDQEVFVQQNTTWTIQIKGLALAQSITYPLGVRIGPLEQLGLN